jgi:hypothetical protein
MSVSVGLEFQKGKETHIRKPRLLDIAFEKWSKVVEAIDRLVFTNEDRSAYCIDGERIIEDLCLYIAGQLNDRQANGGLGNLSENEQVWASCSTHASNFLLELSKS